MPSITVDFLAAGGNRDPSAADWDEESGLFAYGAGRNVALWRPLDASQPGVHALLSGHTDTVNVIKTLRLSSKSAPLILSGAADNSIRVWHANQDTPSSYREACVLKEHQKSINAIAVLPGVGNIFASSSADSEVKIWSIQHGDSDQDVIVTLSQVLPLTPKYFPLTLALARLPGTDQLVLAVAGSKTFVQLYVSKQGKFEYAASLTGHEGWIRSLDFIQEGDNGSGDLLLASASQDKYVRLWRLRHGEELPASSDALNDPALGSIGRSLSNKAHQFETAGEKYSVTFEALLLGHEDWIYTARWYRKDGRIRLLTASADNSLAIWESDPNSGVWLSTVRLGEISAQKGATTATGSTGGFWIGLWGPDGRSVASLGRTGGWRLWSHDTANDLWEQKTAVGGHTREVRGLAWARDGSYLLSTSSDQTSRLYAEWQREGTKSWHEISRPQIHGYDLNCIDTFNDSQFVSGADEKLLRVFDEPQGVANLLSDLCGIESTSSKPLPELASIPVLGLSNKAMDAPSTDDTLADVDTPNTAPTTDDSTTSTTAPSTTSKFTSPPTEDTLSRSLLWPETEKLYGHSSEIAALAASPTLPFIATACRASTADHAVIRIYDTRSWLEVKPALAAHSLTVTSLRWSGDGRWLLSTGRDRGCVVWRWIGVDGGEGDGRFVLWARNEKAHSRMLLDGAWAPPPTSQSARSGTDEALVFATAGRDRNVHIWRLANTHSEASGTFTRISTISAALPVVALAFLQAPVQQFFVLAYALEDGSIWFAKLSGKDLQVQGEVVQLSQELAPAMAVTQMVWRPVWSGGGIGIEGRHQLAVASEDASLRVYSVVMD